MIGSVQDVEKIRRKRLSASVAHDILGCQAKTAAKRLLPDPPDPFGPREIGTSTHSVFEELYTLPAAERTEDVIRAIVDRNASQMWAPENLTGRRTKAALAANALNRTPWVERVLELALGILKIEDPTRIEVVSNELELKDLRIAAGPGVPDGVPFVGYVDRLDLNAPLGAHRGKSDDALRIVDYKTGRYKRPNPRYGDQYGDQGRLYDDAIEVALGRRPVAATLLYPLDGKAHPIDLSEPELRKTRSMFRGAWMTMNRAADEQAFIAQPSNLCGWCQLANSCPVAQITTPKAKASAATQPSREALGIPTVRPGAGPEAALEAWAQVAEGAEPQPVTAAHVVNEPNDAEGDTAASDIETESAQDMTQEVIKPRGEGKSWEEQVDGGFLNRNSYASIAVNALVDDAYALLKQNDQDMSGGRLPAFRDTLAVIVLTVQRTITGSASFQAGAHTRIRSHLMAYARQNPFPFGGKASDLDEWVERAMRTVRNLILAAENLYDAPPAMGSKPWLALADDETGDPVPDDEPPMAFEPEPAGPGVFDDPDPDPIEY